MSKTDRAFRHPTSDELLRMMEEARRERSLHLARLLGVRARQHSVGDGRDGQERPMATSALSTAVC